MALTRAGQNSTSVIRSRSQSPTSAASVASRSCSSLWASASLARWASVTSKPSQKMPLTLPASSNTGAYTKSSSRSVTLPVWGSSSRAGMWWAMVRSPVA